VICIRQSFVEHSRKGGRNQGTYSSAEASPFSRVAASAGADRASGAPVS
jgi:hypothetical protein